MKRRSVLLLILTMVLFGVINMYGQAINPPNITNTGKSIYFSWDNIPEADFYNVYVSDNELPAYPEGNWELIGTTTNTEYFVPIQHRNRFFYVTAATHEGVANPSFNWESGIYTSTRNVTIHCSTPNAIIKFTTDGTEPTDESNVFSGSAINISNDNYPFDSQEVILKARAFRDGLEPSEIVTAFYTITGQVPTPTFNITAGTYYETQNVVINCFINNAVIRYTLDNNDPTEESPIYEEPIEIEVTRTLKAKAFLVDWLPSSTLSALYVISGTVATPTFSVPSGEYETPFNAAIECETQNATIRYTTNGDEPNENSTEYTEPLSISTYTFIKAKAFKENWADSQVAEVEYIFPITVPASMVFVPSGTFQMGRTAPNDTATNTEELPIHNVTLSSSFYIGKYPVKQSEFATILSAAGINWVNDSNPGNPSYPRNNINWYAALVYCNLLSISEGLSPVYTINGSADPTAWGPIPTESNAQWNSVTCNWYAVGYRLPTEAEWEFAAKAGGNENFIYSGSNTANDVAWHESNSNYSMQSVGLKNPNGLGIYDMSGLVLEWCWDRYSSTYYHSSPEINPKGSTTASNRVTRGGQYNFSLINCRVASRRGYAPNDYNYARSFRVVLISP